MFMKKVKSKSAHEYKMLSATVDQARWALGPRAIDAKSGPQMLMVLAYS